MKPRSGATIARPAGRQGRGMMGGVLHLDSRNGIQKLEGSGFELCFAALPFRQGGEVSIKIAHDYDFFS